MLTRFVCNKHGQRNVPRAVNARSAERRAVLSRFLVVRDRALILGRSLSRVHLTYLSRHYPPARVGCEWKQQEKENECHRRM